MTSKLNKPRRRGHSLVEVLIAMSISVVVAGASVWFIAEGTRYSMRTTASATNDFIQWSISSRLQLDSKLANGAAIYSNLTAASIKPNLRRIGGQRGNLLILSLSERDPGSARSRFTRVTGYVYAPGTNILSKFEHIVSSAQQSSYADLETILTTNLSGFTLEPVARGVESFDGSGPFVSRDVGNINAATATFRLQQGDAANHTKDTSVVEISFLIR
jgi:hypothetical protein